MNRFKYEGLRDCTRKIFEAQPFTPRQASDITDVLLTSDLFGIESHGIQRLQMYINFIDEGAIKLANRPEIINETPLSAVIDCHEYMGQVAGMMAVDMALDKAKKHGMSIVCVRMSNHFGIAGYYARKMALEGFTGVCMTNSEAIMVPTFGKHAMIGTNPIAVAMPAEPYPFLFDAATTVVPRGKLEVYRKVGEQIPVGWGVDDTGKITTDPGTIDNCIKIKKGGGVLPLGGAGETYGGHKGYGLGLTVELFTAIFSGGFTADIVRSKPKVEGSCQTYMAIDYGMFGDKKEIENSFSDYLKRIRESDAAEGETRIYTHGEKEMEAYDDRMANGLILNDKTTEEVRGLCVRYGLNPDEYMIGV